MNYGDRCKVINASHLTGLEVTVIGLCMEEYVIVKLTSGEKFYNGFDAIVLSVYCLELDE